MDIQLIQLDVAEAQRREESFLGNLATAQDDYEWIVENQAWTGLGFDTFADWWTARVQPQMRALSMRPTREIAARVIETVRAEEAELPPAQQRTQRELAELAGTSEWVARGRQDHRERRSAAITDLAQDSPPSSGVIEGNEEVSGREQTPAQAGTVLDPPFVEPAYLRDEPAVVEAERRRRLSSAFAADLLGLMLALDPDPVAWHGRTWESSANTYRDMEHSGAAFTSDGLRRLSKHLSQLADHVDAVGGGSL